MVIFQFAMLVYQRAGGSWLVNHTYEQYDIIVLSKYYVLLLVVLGYDLIIVGEYIIIS